VAFFHELGIDTKLSDYTKNYEGTAEEIAKRFKNRGWLGLGEHQSLSPDKVEEIVKMAYSIT
jgi:NADP-dependent alcohol dehydrogenase